MDAESRVEVVRTLAFPIHPRLIERYERERAETAKMLTPEAMARIDRETAEAMRKLLEGE
jgi:hypothetical protein